MKTVLKVLAVLASVVVAAAILLFIVCTRA